MNTDDTWLLNSRGEEVYEEIRKRGEDSNYVGDHEVIEHKS